MKLKSAHIFLAAASLATLTVLAGCGSNSSGDLTSPGYNVGDLRSVPVLASLAVTPQVTTARVAQAVQLTATATLTDGTQADASSLVTWTSSNPSIASVSTTGSVTANLPGTVTITASSGTASATAQFTVNPFINRLFVSDNTNSSILVFATDANGAAVTPLRSIAGTNTGLSGPRQIAVFGQELFVANGAPTDIRVFPLHGEGNIAPTRVIKSSAMSQVFGVTVANNEIFAGNGLDTIFVFNSTDSGTNVTPKRTVTGANTLLLGPNHLTTVGNQVLAANFFPSAVLGFLNTADGNVAPARNLTGPGGNLFGFAFGLTSTNTELFVSDLGNGNVHRFNAGANTTDAPLNTITGLTSPRGLAVLGNELFVGDPTVVKVFPTTQAGAAAPIRTIGSTSLALPTSVVVAGSF